MLFSLFFSQFLPGCASNLARQRRLLCLRNAGRSEPFRSDQSDIETQIATAVYEIQRSGPVCSVPSYETVSVCGNAKTRPDLRSVEAEHDEKATDKFEVSDDCNFMLK